MHNALASEPCFKKVVQFVPLNLLRGVASVFKSLVVPFIQLYLQHNGDHQIWQLFILMCTNPTKKEKVTQRPTIEGM